MGLKNCMQMHMQTYVNHKRNVPSFCSLLVIRPLLCLRIVFAKLPYIPLGANHPSQNILSSKLDFMQSAIIIYVYILTNEKFFTSNGIKLNS